MAKQGGRRLSFEDIFMDLFIYSCLILLCVVTLYPFINTIAYSFNNAIDSINGGIYLLPREFTLRNYEKIFVGNNAISRGNRPISK